MSSFELIENHWSKPFFDSLQTATYQNEFTSIIYKQFILYLLDVPEVQKDDCCGIRDGQVQGIGLHTAGVGQGVLGPAGASRRRLVQSTLMDLDVYYVYYVFAKCVHVNLN